MNDGFIRTAAATPKIRVADPDYNGEQILGMIKEGAALKAKLMVFPELCLTGYTCGDLFLQETLLLKAREELKRLIRETKDIDMLVFVGVPWRREGKLYNAAAVFCRGRLLGVVPKKNIPNYGEFYEARHFAKGNEKAVLVPWEGETVPMGTNLLFRCSTIEGLVAACEICEDVWVPCPPSIGHALAGATVIANCSASDETVGKGEYRDRLIGGQSARLVCAYVYANAGEGESTQDLVFGGHNIIAENGTILADSPRFETGILCGDVDPHPFVPGDQEERNKRCEEILSIQAMGLKKRLEHTGAEHVVLGISGGLDSTLALLVTVRTFDMLKPRTAPITMPVSWLKSWGRLLRRFP